MKEILNFLTIIFILLIKNSKSLEKIKFNMSKFGNTNSNCEPDNGIYHFYLYGDFSSEFNIKDKIPIKLDSPPTIVLCTAYSKGYYSVDSIKCEINICEFPIDGNVTLSPEEPISDYFEFPNWNSFMNKNPGISNTIESTSCYPYSKGYFTPNDIEAQGCNGKNNTFIIKGEWDDESMVTFNKEKFKLPLLYQEGEKAECQFMNLTHFKCSYKGFGEINFDSFYFKAILSTYKVMSLEKSINVTQCNGNSFNKMNFFLIIFSLCLILI